MIAWVGIIDSRILPVFWFVDVRGKPTCVNGECYLSMLKNHLYRHIKQHFHRKNWWLMQGGAAPHCTNANLEFLNKFRGREISRLSSFNWPSHSPELNPPRCLVLGYMYDKNT